MADRSSRVTEAEIAIEPEPATMPCPKCGARHSPDDGAAPCSRCRTVISVVNFTPLLAAAALAPGEGRCQAHPSKDAIDACERCGGYVCDVCATRTGEHLLCPSCFEWQHERGELETTVRARIRWDMLTSMLVVVGMIVPFGGLLAYPAALVTACVTLWKRRRARYLSPVSSVLVLFATLLGVTIFVVVIASGID